MPSYLVFFPGEIQHISMQVLKKLFSSFQILFACSLLVFFVLIIVLHL